MVVELVLKLFMFFFLPKNKFIKVEENNIGLMDRSMKGIGKIIWLMEKVD